VPPVILLGRLRLSEPRATVPLELKLPFIIG
jgi:hypothetical protein